MPKTLTARNMPDELHKRLKRAALDEGVSMREAIRLAIERWLAVQQEKART